MPGSRDPGIDRRKTVQRYEHRRPAPGEAVVDDLGDVAMIGIEDRLPARFGGGAAERFVAGYRGRLADARDRTWRRRRAIAVDHQPRITLRDQMGIELFRQRVGDAGDADVPGDMPRQLAGRQPEIAEGTRDQPAVMVAGQEER